MRLKRTHGLKVKFKNKRVMLGRYNDGRYVIKTRRLVSIKPLEIHSEKICFTEETMGAIVKMWAVMNDLCVVPKYFDPQAVENVPMRHLQTVLSALGIVMRVEFVEAKEEEGSVEG